ncbi:MAG: dodecin family protein [Thermoproteota archaeon]
MSSVAKIIEVIGISSKGWEDAAQTAITEAKKSVHGIHGIKVKDMTADVDESGKITRFKTTVKIAFGVER